MIIVIAVVLQHLYTNKQDFYKILSDCGLSPELLMEKSIESQGNSTGSDFSETMKLLPRPLFVVAEQSISSRILFEKEQLHISVTTDDQQQEQELEKKDSAPNVFVINLSFFKKIVFHLFFRFSSITHFKLIFHSQSEWVIFDFFFSFILFFFFFSATFSISFHYIPSLNVITVTSDSSVVRNELHTVFGDDSGLYCPNPVTIVKMKML